MNDINTINQKLLEALENKDFESAHHYRYNGANNVPYIIGLILNNHKIYFDNKEEMKRWICMLNGVDRW